MACVCRRNKEQSRGRNSIPVDGPAEGMPPDGSVIAQCEGGTDLT